MMSFHKAKVLESGSSSESDDQFRELAVSLKAANTEPYLKKFNKE